jgi:glutamate-1-semialdehyde 2,1-aminomutase
VTEGNAADTLVARYNDVEHVRELVGANEGEVACIIVEPIAGNMGCIPPAEGFLEGLRDLCDAEDIVLIFDEVMTGFRVAAGGAQERYGVTPDLTTLGKIIGGGLPVGAYGGKREIMDYVSPVGPVYQAGTLSGNPLAMRAGYAVLKKIYDEQDRLYDELEAYSRTLEEGTQENLADVGIQAQTTRVGAMSSLFFTDEPVTDYDSAQTCDTGRYADYFHAMLEEGVYLPPSQFEAMFFGHAHGEAELEKTLAAQRTALEQVAK